MATRGAKAGEEGAFLSEVAGAGGKKGVAKARKKDGADGDPD